MIIWLVQLALEWKQEGLYKLSLRFVITTLKNIDLNVKENLLMDENIYLGLILKIFENTM